MVKYRSKFSSPVTVSQLKLWISRILVEDRPRLRSCPSSVSEWEIVAEMVNWYQLKSEGTSFPKTHWNQDLFCLYLSSHVWMEDNWLTLTTLPPQRQDSTISGLAEDFSTCSTLYMLTNPNLHFFIYIGEESSKKLLVSSSIVINYILKTSIIWYSIFELFLYNSKRGLIQTILLSYFIFFQVIHNL